MNKFAYFLRRLREPSTLAGLSALGMLAGLPPGTLDMSLQILAGVAGLAAVVLPEKAAEK